MPDESPPTDSGWLPPRAPQARPAPHFERQAHHGWEPPRPASRSRPEPEPLPYAPAHAGGPTFVKPGASGAARGAGGTAERNGLAIAAVVCGAAGLLLLVVSLGLWFPVALPLSAAAWVCGVRARRRAAERETAAGGGQARAGLILGIIGVVLGIVAAAVWLYLLASGVSLDEIQRDLQQELERRRDGAGDGDAVQALSSLFGRALRS